ncbi:MAG: nucleotidyltransferase domain-containing protein [Chloroflexi bacterium]|nr:nucleotidyltransferase domain-containing protein [Chloroflexota bacterium]
MGRNISNAKTIPSIILAHYPATQAIYLFGSYATDHARLDSDIDIGLLLPPDQSRRENNLVLSQCRYDLQDALSQDVDLLNARQVSTVFQKEIIGGDRLYCADRYAADEFEMLVLSYYQKLNEERRDILNAFYRTGRAYAV